MNMMFAVIRMGFTPCECGASENKEVEFVTFNKETAENFVKEKMKAGARTSWSSVFEIEEVEVRD